MKMRVRWLYGPEDPDHHNERIEVLFSAVKRAAELWAKPGKMRGVVPKWCRYKQEVCPKLKITEGSVRYDVEGGGGVFFFTPQGVSFVGDWAALIADNSLCRVKLVGYPPAPRRDGTRRLEDLKPVQEGDFSSVMRADIEIFAPITQDKVLIYQDSFYHPDLEYED